MRSNFPKFSKRALGLLSKFIHPSVFAGLRGQTLALAGVAAFSDELDYAPSIWLNRRSHFNHGHLTDDEADTLMQEIAQKLRELHDPVTKAKLFDEVWCRPAGKAFSSRIPDIVLEPSFINGYRTSFLSSDGPGPIYRELPPKELRAGRGYGMPGVHHADGVLVLYGKGWPQADLPKLNIADAGAVALGLLKEEVPDWSDWRRPTGLETWNVWPPTRRSTNTIHAQRPDQDHTMPPEVWERLKQWGYVN